MNHTQIATESQITPDEAKASLGIATHLQEQMMMPQAPQEAPSTPPDGQNQTKTEEVPKDNTSELESLKTGLSTEMESFKQEVKDDLKKQIDGLKQDIKDALNE